jgi:excinuclease ABC subunit C
MEEPLESDAEAVSGLVRQYYTMRGALPSVILLPVEIEDREPLEELLTQAAGRKVKIETPKRGERLKLVEAAALNAREECLRATTAVQRRLKTLEWLQKALELPKLPERIEAFDVSNLGNEGIVAAMTVFWRGKPLKRDYRKFRIKETEGQDDYHSMQEVLTRRFRRYLEGDEKFGTLPDLLLIDGGAAHAGAAEEVLRGLGISLPVFGMVKDHRHRTRGLVSSQGREIGLSGNPAVFALIGSIQEETHRFAIEYQRSLRSAGLGSELDRIKGVGEKRRSAFLRHFKTIKAIREASLEELCQAVPRNTAQAVWEHFHGQKGEEA